MDSTHPTLGTATSSCNRYPFQELEGDGSYALPLDIKRLPIAFQEPKRKRKVRSKKAPGEKTACRAEQVPSKTHLNVVHVELGRGEPPLTWQSTRPDETAHPREVETLFRKPEATSMKAEQKQSQPRARAKKPVVESACPVETPSVQVARQTEMDVNAWDERERHLIKQWVTADGYSDPAVFPILTQLAISTSATGQLVPMSTEQLVDKCASAPDECTADVFHILKRCWELGLVNRDGAKGRIHGAGSVWSLTDDGKRYFMSGIKTRLQMVKVNRKNTPEQICRLLGNDEIHDWESELRERAIKVQRVRRGETTGEVKRRRLPSKLDDVTPPVVSTISRSEVAQAIEAQALDKARQGGATAGTPWSGLIR